MLIEKFVVPANELTNVGLQAIKMDRLGRFVALAGKNGAGKSRILNVLNRIIPERNLQIVSLSNIEAQIQGQREVIQANNPEHPNQRQWKRNLEQLLMKKSIVNDRILSPINIPLGALYFVPKQLGLTDPRQNHKAALQNHYVDAKNPGLDRSHHSCFSYIQALQDMEFEVSHPRSTHEPTVIQETKEEYEKLESLIDLLLKTRISRSISGDATLFGKPLAEAGLSDGQKVLLQLAVALHAQKGKLDNTVFLMDEPENHLHPAALIEFLDTLAEVAVNSQFWIATHSVPLLAHIAKKEPMSIWYVEAGEVNNAGSKPANVLRGLLGNDEQIENLNAFTSLPAQYAAITFFFFSRMSDRA
jgi:energy-coupling factor transporter ATP-binding protein EcfA2